MLREIFIIINILVVLIKSECPTPESIYPCICYAKSFNIHCTGNSINALKLDNLGDKQLNILYINNTNISSINSLGNSSWNQTIIQNNKELQSIAEHVFKKGPKQKLWISNNPKLDNNNLFKEIRHIEITETIQLDGNNIKELMYGFSNNSKVKNLLFHNNKIFKITSNLFSGLKELIQLGLDHNEIDKIEDFGLNLTTNNSNGIKIIVLLNDNKLNDNSFTSKAFAGDEHISLDINFENNDFTTIDEKVFGPLVRSQKNHLNFENNDINCNCDMLWLLNNTTKTYVSSIGCNEQKKSLYDLNKSDLKCPTTTSTTPSTTPSTTLSTTPSTTQTTPKTTPTTTIKTTPSTTQTTPKTMPTTTIKTTVNPKTGTTNDSPKTSPTTLKSIQTISISPTPMPSTCPPSQDITPCTCDQNSLSIQCLGLEINDINISKIGSKISSKFDSIRISATSLKEIPKFVFIKAKFNKILIEGNEKLERIDSDVFVKSITDIFIVRNNPKLSDSSVFDLAKKLDSIEVILSNNALKELPENAFVEEENPVNERLTRISLDHNQIEIITSNAFTGLTNLNYLSLNHNLITIIEDYGLKLSTAFSHLNILLNNNKLNSTSFTMRSIDISDKITLNFNLAENQLTLLSENIFKNILNRNKSEMNLHGNKFICDCNMKWLLNETISRNVLNVFCDNKQKHIFDLSEKDLYCLQCPTVENINPCICSQTSLTIQCSGQSVNDELIGTIGPKIQSNTLLSYKSIVISNTNLKNLQKSLFSNANFSEIIIEDNKNLVKIDPQMFNKNQIISLKITNNKNLSDSIVFELAKNLDPLVVNFSNNAIEEIPEFAFIQNENSFNKRLSVIILDHNRIDTIPSNAFIGLSNLTHLSLNYNLISTIDEFGLKLTTINYNFIKVFLNNNNLNMGSFSSKSIDISENITLTLHLENNKITTLSENLFKPIFVKNGNEIILNGNKFFCDCHMKWLLIEPQSQKNYHIECNNKGNKFIFELSPKELTCSSDSY